MRFLLLFAILFPVVLPVSAFDRSEWSVRCWNGDEKRWKDVGVDKMTFAEDGGVTRVTNTTGIHRHAHLVFPAELTEDFSFSIKLKGGYELGFLNREGKDEMLYLELDGNQANDQEFTTYVLSRKGTRFSIAKEGRAMPLVHFRFDYGEAFLITLALKEGESAEIGAYSLESSG